MPSRTAEYMALFRALEGTRARRRRLFVDPLARSFLAAPLRRVADASRVPGVGWLARAFIDRRWPGVRTSAVARTRFLDDRVASALTERGAQLVILGAGFDARFLRLPACRDRRVFEVDHPATQARKRELVEDSLGALPVNVCFVPVDFDRDPLETRLAAAGWDPGRPTLYLWEGVTNYLTAEAVDATLRACARSAPGSQILFTYIHRDVLENPVAFFGTQYLLRSLAAAGERWTFGLDPAQLAAYLEERGLSLAEDVGAAEYRAECYGAAATHMRGYEFYRIARAVVPERAVPPTAGGGGVHPRV